MPTPEHDPRPPAAAPEPAREGPPAPKAAPANGAVAAASGAAAPEKNGEESDAEAQEGKKKFASKKGVETMFRTSYRTNMDLSSLADSKANIMISINGLIVSILIASISPKIDANPLLLVPTVLLLLGCMTSLIFAILAARPRVQSRAVTLDQVRRGDANLLFFGNFAHLSREDFMLGMEELMLDKAGVYQNMIMDIYGLGLVLQKKYRLLRLSYTTFMVGLIVGVVAFIVVFFLAAKTGQPAPNAVTPIPIVPAP